MCGRLKFEIIAASLQSSVPLVVVFFRMHIHISRGTSSPSFSKGSLRDVYLRLKGCVVFLKQILLQF